jgi:hypothetical protein
MPPPVRCVVRCSGIRPSLLPPGHGPSSGTFQLYDAVLPNLAGEAMKVLAEAPDVLAVLGDCVDVMLGVMEERTRYITQAFDHVMLQAARHDISAARVYQNYCMRGSSGSPGTCTSAVS